MRNLCIDSSQQFAPPFVAPYATSFMVLPDPIPATPATNAPFLRRIAIGISPQFEIVSRRKAAKLPPVTNHHLTIQVVKKRTAASPWVGPAPTTSVVLEIGDIGPALIRHALGVSPVDATGALKTALAADDFVHVATTVARVLKDPTGAKRVVQAGP